MMEGDLLKEVAKMGDEDYMAFVVKTFNARGPLTQKTLQRRLGLQGKKNCKKAGDGWKGMLVEGDPTEYPSKPKPTSSKEASCAAFKVPFVHRSDLLKVGGVVFLDVEKLSLKKVSSNSAHRQVASEVAVVNDNRDLVLWSFIRWEKGSICQTFPELTGITKEKLEIGMPLDDVKKHLRMVFDGVTVIGWDVKNDLAALELDGIQTDDLAGYFIDELKQPYRLKDVYKHLFGKQIQCEMHCAINDARATRDIFHRYLELKEKYPEFKDYPGAVVRSPREKFHFNPNDVCKCPKKKKSNGKYYVPN